MQDFKFCGRRLAHKIFPVIRAFGKPRCATHVINPIQAAESENVAQTAGYNLLSTTITTRA